MNDSIKKTDLVGCSEQELLDLFEHIKSVFLSAVDNNRSIAEAIQNEIIAVYKDKPLFPAATYLVGEIIGKVELGYKLGDIVLNLAEEIKKAIEKETDQTDFLLDMYSQKKVARC